MGRPGSMQDIKSGDSHPTRGNTSIRQGVCVTGKVGRPRGRTKMRKKMLSRVYKIKTTRKSIGKVGGDTWVIQVSAIASHLPFDNYQETKTQEVVAQSAPLYVGKRADRLFTPLMEWQAIIQEANNHGHKIGRVYDALVETGLVDGDAPHYVEPPAKIPTSDTKRLLSHVVADKPNHRVSE